MFGIRRSFKKRNYWILVIVVLFWFCPKLILAFNFTESACEIDTEIAILTNILNIVDEIEEARRQTREEAERAKKMEEERDEAQRELANVERCLQIKRQKKWSKKESDIAQMNQALKVMLVFSNGPVLGLILRALV